MDHDEMFFEEFLASRMRDKGITLKRLAEATGVAPNHLENLLHGNFEDMPSAPYFRGYILRIGKVLDFNGEEWWERVKKDGHATNSGPKDALPRNRFTKRAYTKYFWIAIPIILIVTLYLGSQIPRILGKPSLTVSYPTANPHTASESTIMLQGMVQGADELYLSNGNSASSEKIAIAPDGSWQKQVLLQNGLNAFQITAKKFLGAQTVITREIIYQGVPQSTSSATSSALFPIIHNTIPPATGTFFQ
jgi:cytoskeletal protein RodZ